MTDRALPLSQQTLSVGQLTRYLRALVEQDDVLAALSVHGEISDLSRAASGHLYFTLKDATSQLACVLFRREALQQAEIARELRRGVSVIVHGFLTIYEPRGTYQIYVERVIPQGEGALLRRLERLREQLEREGLFAGDRKRSLPPFPRKLALVTAPGSQAYHDVLHRLRSQYPFVQVIEVGVSVQGDGAADEMAMAIDIVNRLTDAEVILLVRGGGAPEELAAFNEEVLARAVFASRIPVITGVGHETDHTIVDFVADHRAATPSLAAATAVPDLQALMQRMAQTQVQLRHAIRQRLRGERSRWIAANHALLRSSPHNRLRVQHQRADELQRIMNRSIAAHLRAKRAHLRSLQSQLAALDPLSILQRGYAMATDAESGEVVSRVQQAEIGRRVRIRVSDGEFVTRVEER